MAQFYGKMKLGKNGEIKETQDSEIYYPKKKEA